MKDLISYLIIFLLPYFSSSQVFYVSPTGNDSNSGQSISQAFKTIQKGVNMAIDSGAVLNIMQGTYYEHVVLPTNVATMTNPITIQNYLNDIVIVDGNGILSPAGSALFLLQDLSNVIVKGIKFVNAGNSFVKGLIVRGHCENIVIRNCAFENISFSNNFSDTVLSTNSNSSPIIVYADSISSCKNIEISKVIVKHCNTGLSEAMTISGNVDGFKIYDCNVSDIRNIGIDIAGHWGVCSDSMLDQARNGVVARCVVSNCKNPNTNKPASGIYIDGARNVVIENDTVFDCQNGITVGCENKNKVANADTVRNNIVYKNSRAGIEVGGWNYPPAPLTDASGIVTNCYVSGNTTVKNNLDTSLWAGELRITHNENLRIENNLIYGESNHHVLLDYRPNNGSNNKLNYNLYYTPTSNVMFNYTTGGYSSFATYKLASGQDVNSKFIDPKFIDTANDFHLQSTSPAIDAGDPTYFSSGIEYDIDGQTRIIGKIDCGADETNYPNFLGGLTQTDLLVYPNPFNNIVYFSEPIETKSKIYITSLFGDMVYSKQIEATRQSLDLSDLQTGIYLLYITNNKGWISCNKIIKY